MGKLGQLLVTRGWITVQQLTRALQNQSVVGGRLGTCLLELDALSEDLLLKGLAEQLGVPSANLDDLRGIPEEVLALIPDKLARRCRAVPFRLEGSRLDLAMMDARNLACQDEIAFATGKRVKIHVAHELRILEALERYYKEEAPSRFSLLVERLNRARYFWERPGERTAESATTLATPLSHLPGGNRPKLSPPPPLPDVPAPAPARQARPAPAAAAPAPKPAAAPLPAPPAPAAAAGAAPRAVPRPVKQSVSLTPEEMAELGLVTARPAPPAPAPARPAAAPASIEEVEKAFEATRDREEVGRIVLGFLARSHRRAALFQVGRDKVTAWLAQGEGVDLTLFRSFSVGFDKPSLFLNLREGSSVYIGPMPPMPAHRELALAWGGDLPRDCVMLPVRMRDRLVTVIYADGAKKLDLMQLQRLATSTATAFERCILRKKQEEAKS
ncbi:MAG TPA: hypothetical protein VF756_25145 [Thermoanaerobaculia bacterium]